MALTRPPWFQPQLTDQYGHPLVGSKFYAYAAGTLVYQPVFSDIAGTTPIAQGATVPSSGWFPFFVEPGKNYDFVFKTSAGVTIWTAEDVPAIPASASNQDITGIAGVTILAGQACYLSDGSGGLTAGSWYLADADFQYASLTPTIGFAVSGIAQGETGIFRLGGTIDNGGPLVIGAPYFVSTIAGDITATAPANERRLGQAQTATVLLITANPALPTVDPRVCEGRLTLTTGVPVTTADVTAATAVKWCPYLGNQVALYSGTVWALREFSELSIAVPASVSSINDVFIYDNAGTPTLELTAWTNDTTRAVALTTQDGILVRAGSLTRRYVGSFRTTAVVGQTEDSLTKRYVWNYYNRVSRPLQRFEATASWVWDTGAWRQANAAAANQVEVVIGVSEEPVRVDVTGRVNSVTTGAFAAIGIGLDALTLAANVVGGIQSSVLNDVRQSSALYRGFPGIGRHYFAWLERAGAGASGQTWYGANSPLGVGEQSGLTGEVCG